MISHIRNPTIVYYAPNEYKDLHVTNVPLSLPYSYTHASQTHTPTHIDAILSNAKTLAKGCKLSGMGYSRVMV